jgi:hypothetical protein
MGNRYQGLRIAALVTAAAVIADRRHNEPTARVTSAAPYTAVNSAAAVATHAASRPAPAAHSYAAAGDRTAARSQRAVRTSSSTVVGAAVTAAATASSPAPSLPSPKVCAMPSSKSIPRWQSFPPSAAASPAPTARPPRRVVDRGRQCHHATLPSPHPHAAELATGGAAVGRRCRPARSRRRYPRRTSAPHRPFHRHRYSCRCRTALAGWRRRPDVAARRLAAAPPLREAASAERQV